MYRKLIKSVWPDWTIYEAPLGKGSFGVVYEAVKREFSIESRAAIKVISIPQDDIDVQNLIAEGMSNEDIEAYYKSMVNEFTKEIAILASFKGAQNIVGIDDYKVKPRNPIGWNILIRMEKLTPLNFYFRHYERNESTVIKLGIDICTALEYCAQRNVVHRDIKPENIFVNTFGDFVLGDFGVARSLAAMTNSMSQKGTYNYMAPEVQRGVKYNGTVDLYSLGLVLYRLLNRNKLPFLDVDKKPTHNDRYSALKRRLRGDEMAAPCEATSEMGSIILKACAFNPADRYQSATEMKRDLVLLKEKLYPGLNVAKKIEDELSDAPDLIGKVAHVVSDDINSMAATDSSNEVKNEATAGPLVETVTMSEGSEFAAETPVENISTPEVNIAHNHEPEMQEMTPPPSFEPVIDNQVAMNGTPIELYGTPNSMSHVDILNTPSKLRMSADIYRTPIEVPATPSHLDRTPSEIAGTPVNLSGTPQPQPNYGAPLDWSRGTSEVVTPYMYGQDEPTWRVSAPVLGREATPVNMAPMMPPQVTPGYMAPSNISKPGNITPKKKSNKAILWVSIVSAIVIALAIILILIFNS